MHVTMLFLKRYDLIGRKILAMLIAFIIFCIFIVFFSFFNYVLRMQRFIIILKKVDIFLFVIFFFTLNGILFEILHRKTMIYVTFMNVFRLWQLHSLEINSMTVNA